MLQNSGSSAANLKKSYAKVANQIGTAVGRKTNINTSKDLAMAICNPASCTNLRFKSNPSNADATVAVQLHTYATYKQATLSATHVYSAAQPLGTGTLALFRDAFRAYVQYECNPDSETHTYNASFPNNIGTAYVDTAYINQKATLSLAPNWLVAQTTFRPHGINLYPGLDDAEYRWIWMDKADVATFTQASAANKTGWVYVYLWDGSASQLVHAVAAFSGSVATFTSTLMGYYNFEVENTDSADFMVGFSISGASETYSHHPAPAVEDHFGILTNYRLDAASLMMSPVSNVTVMNGSIIAAWLSPGQAWYNYLDNKVTATLMGAERFDFKTGVYGFLKPHSEADFTYLNNVSMVGSIVTKIGFSMSPHTRTTVFNYLVDATTMQNTTNMALGCEYVLTYIANMEMVCNDQFHEQHLPSSSYSEFVGALEAVSTVSPYHENPLHWSDITKALRTGFGFVKKHAGTLGTALSAMFPQFSPAISAGAGLLGAL